MPVEQLTNGQTATLTSPISSHIAGATVTIGVDVAIGIADARQMRVEIGRELFLVTAGMGTLSMTATAAVEGTTPAAHAAGVAVVQVVTAAGISNLQTLPSSHGHSSTSGDGGNLRGIQNGYAPLDSGLLVPVAYLATGTPTGSKYLRDDRTWAVPPGTGVTDHALLSNVTAAQHHTNANDPTANEKAALAGTSGTATSGSNKLVDNADSRNTNSRTPTTHETTHRSAGSDPLSHANLAALTTGDPHTQYQQESEKGAASGYASLDSGTLVPKAQLGSGTADNTTYLRGDGTWNTPSAGASTSFAGARVYNTANISVASGGSGTTLTFDTERYDTDAFHSTSSNTSRLTVPSGKGGKYHMEGHAQFASGTTGERELRVLLNGTTIIAANTEQGLIAENVTVHVSTDYELAVGDYVELVAFQDGIGSLNVLAAGNYSPEFSCSLWGGSGSGLYSATLLFEDQKASGTHGGTFTSGGDRTRDLNIEVVDTGNNGSVSGNQLTLAAGTYDCDIDCPAHNVFYNHAWLYDVTHSATLLEGRSVYCGADVTTISRIRGRIVLSGTTVLEVRHRCSNTNATFGFGVASGGSFTVGHETYTSAEFRKV